MTTDTIVRVNPGSLLVGPNVRKEITLPADFVASVKQHGVKIPIVAQETPDGLEVVDGQMRTLAAIDAGLDEVPVFVRATVDDENRVVDQLVMNRERTSLSRADTVAAVKQLALDFKLPASDVAKRVGLSKKDVEQVVAIAVNKHATAALDRDDVSLELAAKIAEAGLSAEEAQEVLASRWNPDHALQQVVSNRAAAEATARLSAEQTVAGVPLVAKPTKGEYDVQEKNKHRYVDELVVKDSGNKITAEDHATCPGHGVWVGARGYRGEVEAHFVCTDPSKNGHRDRNQAAPTPLTDEEKAERVRNSAAAKVWPAIVEVRQTWIREELLARKSAPVGWETLQAWITLELAGSGGSWEVGPLAAEMLGVTERGYNMSALTKWVAANPTKTAIALLAAAIAKFELSAGVSKSWKGWKARMIAEYLELLQSWGYGLSELEQSIVDAAKTGTSGA